MYARRTLTALLTLAATTAAIALPAGAASAGSTHPSTPMVAAQGYLTTVMGTALDDEQRHGMAYMPYLKEAARNYLGTIDLKSIRDKDKNRYDDDGLVSFRVSRNGACLNLRTGELADHACGTKKRPDFTPLQTAAKTLDEVNRAYHSWSSPGDPASLWNTEWLTYIATGDVDPGIKVTLTDRNRDGIEDDGRIEFAKNGKKVCLTLPRDRKAKSAITFGRCATSRRTLPLDARNQFAAVAADLVRNDLREAAVFEETYLTDHPDRQGVAFTATHTKPVTLKGAGTLRPAKGVTITSTFNKNGYCLKGTHKDLPGKAHSIWYDSAAGGLQQGYAKPRGGAC